MGPLRAFGGGPRESQHAVARRVVCAEMPAVGLDGVVVGVAKQPGRGYSCGSCAVAPDVVVDHDGFDFWRRHRRRDCGAVLRLEVSGRWSQSAARTGWAVSDE